MSIKRFSLRLVVSTALTLTLATAAWSAAGTATLADAAPTDDRPNFVFVLVDDADAGALASMPLIQSLVADQGATLDHFMFNQALCCPSRATMLRGQYSQNTGVTGNDAPDGGYAAFYNKGNEASTFATWFHDAGYATGYLGKYFNGYASGGGVPDTHIPVGWDRWFGLLNDDGSRYYDYPVNDQGVVGVRGHAPADYGTDVLADEAQQFLLSQDGVDPFLLEVAVRAPHGPATPADRHKTLFSGVTYPHTPSFNEASINDKPSWIKALPKLKRGEIDRLDTLYRDRLRTMQAVDEMVADIVATLRQGELENTYILVTTDNGWHMGEHRMPKGKNTPYEEDIRVPMYIRGPGIPGGQQITELIGNVDLAPTLAEAAGVVAPDFVDGRSFLPLIRGDDVPWRVSYLLGRGGDEPDGFAGVRTEQYVYIEYNNGEGEFYDLARDPWELDNAYRSMSSALRDSLHSRVEALRSCSGESCRVEEAVAIGAAAP